MGDSFRVELEGLDDLERKLVAIRKEVGAILEQAAQAGADVVAREANSLAPGPNIKTEVVAKTWTHADINIGPDRDHWYYMFFETGAQAHEITPRKTGGLKFPGREGEMVVRVFASHQGMGAVPFLRPAMDAKRDEAEDATGREFLKVIQKYYE